MKVDFPADYGSPDVAGKTAEFAVTVKKVEEQSLPALDDEFCRAFGVAEGGIDALRVEVRKSMERELADAIRNKLRVQVMDALHRDNTHRPAEVDGRGADAGAAGRHGRGAWASRTRASCRRATRSRSRRAAASRSA